MKACPQSQLKMSPAPLHRPRTGVLAKKLDASTRRLLGGLLISNPSPRRLSRIFQLDPRHHSKLSIHETFSASLDDPTWNLSSVTTLAT